MIQPAAFYHWSYMSCLSYVMIFYYNLYPPHISNAQRGSLFKKQDLPAVTMKLIVSETLQLFFIISVEQKLITKTLAIGHGFWGQLEPPSSFNNKTKKKKKKGIYFRNHKAILKWKGISSHFSSPSTLLSLRLFLQFLNIKVLSFIPCFNKLLDPSYN